MFETKTHTPLIAIFATKSCKNHGPFLMYVIMEWGRVFAFFRGFFSTFQQLSRQRGVLQFLKNLRHKNEAKRLEGLG